MIAIGDEGGSARKRAHKKGRMGRETMQQDGELEQAELPLQREDLKAVLRPETHIFVCHPLGICLRTARATGIQMGGTLIYECQVLWKCLLNMNYFGGKKVLGFNLVKKRF